MLFANIGPKMAFQINKRTKTAPTSIKNRTILAKGGGKGYQQINKKMWKQQKNEKTCFCIMCGEILENQRTQRLSVYQCFGKTSVKNVR